MGAFRSLPWGHVKHVHVKIYFRSNSFIFVLSSYIMLNVVDKLLKKLVCAVLQSVSPSSCTFSFYLNLTLPCPRPNGTKSLDKMISNGRFKHSQSSRSCLSHRYRLLPTGLAFRSKMTLLQNPHLSLVVTEQLLCSKMMICHHILFSSYTYN